MMKKKFLTIILFFILMITIQITNSVNATTSGSYDITVAENGNSFVFLSLTGNGTINIPLPLDVDAPTVENTLYIQAENGIDVLLSDEEYPVVVTYATSLLTSKVGEDWNFEIELSSLDSMNITLSLPKNARILKVSPKNGFIRNLENSNEVIWELKREENEIQNISITATVSYNFFEITPTTTTTIITTTTAIITITTTTTQPEKQIQKEVAADNYSLIYYIFAFGVVILAIIIILFYFSKQQRKPKKKEIEKVEEWKEEDEKIKKEEDVLVLSKGKRNVMKTLSGNEIKIINTLLEHEGKMLRNDLEKISGIPKSSLSVAINNLERKNIIQVDKSEWTHEVELTEWFKSL